MPGDHVQGMQRGQRKIDAHERAEMLDALGVFGLA